MTSLFQERQTGNRQVAHREEPEGGDLWAGVLEGGESQGQEPHLGKDGRIKPFCNSKSTTGQAKGCPDLKHD